MKMEELKTSTIFFLLAVDGRPVGVSSDARNAVIRAYHGISSIENGDEPEVAISRAGRLFRKTIVAEEQRAVEEASGLFATVDSLKMLTVEAMFSSVREQVYKADPEIFSEASHRIMESVETKSVDEKTAMLIWLLREAGCLPEFIPEEDLKKLGSIEGIMDFKLWNEFIGKKLELGEKRRADSYPECERFEPIFMENILLNGDDRKKALVEYIEKGRHTVEPIGNALKIDNRLYACNMDAVLKDRIARKGINLVPVLGGIR